MDTLVDVLAEGRGREGVAFEAPGRRTPTTHREFATNAWKAGNLLRHYGVRPGSRVAVVVGPKEADSGTDPGRLGSAPDPLLGLLGGAAAGATVDVTPDSPVEARALVAPAPWLDRYEVAPGCSVLAYGGPPERPEVAHFERERWSENPTEPPGTVAADDPVLRVDGSEYSHAELLDAARGIIGEHTLGAGDSVAVDAPLTSAGAVVAAVIAPLIVGATVRPVGGGSGRSATDAVYTVSEGTDSAASAGTNDDTGTVVDPSAVID